ncbi:MAG: hypothetical protein ACP5D1_11235 [Bacteroidales bacterium]
MSPEETDRILEKYVKATHSFLVYDHFLVVRVEALEEKYPGGVLSFAGRFGVSFNNRIAVIKSKKHEKVEACIESLGQNQLTAGKDYITGFFIPLPDPVKGYIPSMHIHCPWLIARETPFMALIRFNDPLPELLRKKQKTIIRFNLKETLRLAGEFILALLINLVTGE